MSVDSLRMTDDAAWKAAVAGMSSTWRDCHLIGDDIAREQYREALQRWTLAEVRAGMALLRERREMFPPIAAWVSVRTEIVNREEPALRLTGGQFPSLDEQERQIDQLLAAGEIGEAAAAALRSGIEKARTEVAS